MKSIKHNGEGYVIYTKEEAEANKIAFVPWRSIFLRRNQHIKWVLDDDQWVQPVVNLYRRTILVTPCGTVSRTSKTNTLRNHKTGHRLGGRGFHPPGDGRLTEKHLAFVHAYIAYGFDSHRAFRSIWRHRGKRPAEQRQLARQLIEDPKIQRCVMENVKNLMSQYGLDDDFLFGQMKDQIQKGSAATKADLLKTAMKMAGHLSSAGAPGTPGLPYPSGMPYPEIETSHDASYHDVDGIPAEYREVKEEDPDGNSGGNDQEDGNG